MTDSTARILVIEDNHDLAYGLRNNLEIEGYEVEVATTGTEGLGKAQTFNPDVILLDLMLPEMDGFRVLRELRSVDTETAVLILTARGEESDKVRGLRLGADDYVTKPFGVLELLARVEALLRRSRSGSIAREVDSFGDVVIDINARTVTKQKKPVSLTPLEFDLLVALLRRNGSVASRLDLLHEVWGHQGAVVTRTVDTHIAELRRKLECDPANPRHILTARKAGYSLSRE